MGNAPRLKLHSRRERRKNSERALLYPSLHLFVCPAYRQAGFPLREWLQLRKYALDGRLAYLGGDREEEFTSLAQLALNPYRVIHQRRKTLRY